MARPATFDRDAVLEKAMEAFWDRGYCATSMSELVTVTALKPGSLYAAFQSKSGLFMAVLDHYGRRSTARIGQFLADAESPLEGVRGYLRMLADNASDPDARHGCLLVNTVLELADHDDALRGLVNRHLDAIESLFRQALETAQASGELSPQKDPGALAACLMTALWGMRVLSRTHASRERTEAVVDQLLLLFV